MTHNLRHQDSLNSSGTISRKTSTASDYTPEHTLFQDSKVTQPDSSANEHDQEFLVAEIGSSQDNSESKIEMSDIDISSSRELSNTSISTVSGDYTVRRDSQTQLSDREILYRQDTPEKYDENNQNETYFEPILQNTTGLTYAEVTKSPKKESGLHSDEDYISVTSSQYTDTITSFSDVTSGHSSGSDSKITQKIELKICLLQNENDKIKRKTTRSEEKENVGKENTPLGSPQKKAENGESKLKVPQRKISRFLVSPVLEKLDVPKDKMFGGEQDNQQMDTGEQVPQDISQASQDNIDKIDAIPNLEVATNSEVKLDKLESEGPVCGPEMINTLEQLKISLQNITHAQLATTVAQPATPQPPVVTSKVNNQKPSMIGEPPNQSQLYSGVSGVPGGEMLLTIDTQSSVPTPIITPTLQRQMSHSSTEPQLSTVNTQAG